MIVARIPLPSSGRRVFALLLFGILTRIIFHYVDVDHKYLLTRINQLPFGVESRLFWWDGQDTAEEKFCQAGDDVELKSWSGSATATASKNDNSSKASIPNVVHFIFLAHAGEVVNVTYAQFLAVKAAILRIEGAKIRIHTNGLDTTGYWWRQLANHTTIVPINHTTVYETPGHPLHSLAPPHQADLLRLAILRREGGIYLDTDVYVLQPFAPLLRNPRDAILGHEGGNRYGLCNAVIVARAESEYLRLWEQAYESFDPRWWNLHSVRIPKRLQSQRQYAQLVCPLSPRAFFWPTWATTHLRYMFEPITPDEAAALRAEMAQFGGAMSHNQLAFHATSVASYLAQLTPEDVEGRLTRFNVLVRDIARAPL